MSSGLVAVRRFVVLLELIYTVSALSHWFKVRWSVIKVNCKLCTAASTYFLLPRGGEEVRRECGKVFVLADAKGELVFSVSAIIQRL